LKHRGFTLVELIIALAIFSTLSLGIFFAFGTSLRTYNKILNSCATQQIRGMALSRITKDIRSASDVLTGSDQDLLRLKIESDIIEYSLANKKIKRKINNYSSYLTVEGEIRGLTFSYPTKEKIKIILDGHETIIFMRNYR
jgi:prepilin-type N-terminal cleavage/methylation domain-containing protein